MSVQILGGIPARLFDEITALRVDGRAATLLDATGAVLVDSVQTLPPVITEQPQILPASAGPGDSVTLSLGTASGQPAPQPIWDFIRDGVSIRGSVDSFMAIELPSPGLYELSVRWENGAGPAAVATTAQLHVQSPTLPAPPIDYAQVALAYIDAQTPISGTDTDVTAVNALGTGALRLVKTGSGAAIRRTAAGFVFADGAYLQSQTLSGQPTTDGLFAVIDFTLDSYGSSVGQLLDGGGGHVKFRNNADNLQTVGQDDTSVALNLGGTVYGQRMVMAAQIDDVQDLLSAITPAGTEISVPHPGLSDPAITRASMGRYLIGTIHRLVIVGRGEGAGWPVTMAEVVADFRRGV